MGGQRPVRFEPCGFREFLISNCSASTYGLNHLPDGVSIPRERSYRFTVSAGCWDVDAGTSGVGEARQRMTVAPNQMTRYTVTGG